MKHAHARSTWNGWAVRAALAAVVLTHMIFSSSHAQQTAGTEAEFKQTVQPLLQKYCLGCHSTEAKKGSLDLERFASLDLIRKDLKPWQQLIEQVEADEMPPKSKPQPTDAERKTLIAWTRRLLDSEARARAGDPGFVPLRRLSNTEYDKTILALTGVDLRPTREFPADGAAGEGFTNAAEALSDISPTLLNKYLNAARDISEHVVLLPDGFRFSPSDTRRDWTDESTSRLREFYSQFVGPDGKLPIQAYIAAAVRHREALLAGKVSPEEVAAAEKLNAKYFGLLIKTLRNDTVSAPLASIRSRWQKATEQDVPALVAEITRLQGALWKTARVGSYMRPEGNGYAVNLSRQVPVDPPAVNTVPMRFAFKPSPGQTEVTLSLATRDIFPADGRDVVWHRPRFEAAGKPPLLLRDYADFGPAFEIEYPSLFVNSTQYLKAVVEAANSPDVSLEDLAKKYKLDLPFLTRWSEVVSVEPLKGAPERKTIPAVAMEPLPEKVPPSDIKSINGWRKQGTDLPLVVSNASDQVHQIPGTISPHAVAVHPMPQEFVAVVWKSPIAGEVRVAFQVTHAHPACGNGVAWWLESHRAGRATELGEGAVDLGKSSGLESRKVIVQKGDSLVLAVDARDASHVCDLTELRFTVTQEAKPARVWDLAKDVADDILAGNPHPDQHGNADTWQFVRGPSKGSSPAQQLIPPESVLGLWQRTAGDPERQQDVPELAARVQALLSGPRPAKAATADLELYDKLLAFDGPLFTNVDVVRLAKPRSEGTQFGLPKARFGTQSNGQPVEAASLVATADSVTTVKLPAALLARYEFVVEGHLRDNSSLGKRVVQFRVGTNPISQNDVWGAPDQVLTSAESAGYRQLTQGNADFRNLFPLFLCFPQVIPNDEVVSLKMFHREDEPLSRLFLDVEQQQRLDRMWDEHEFISRQWVMEHDYLPQFIGFVTQDQPQTMVDFFRAQAPAFEKRADEQRAHEEAAIPQQLDRLLAFAELAYRRPLEESEQADLRVLYKTMRAKGYNHDAGFRRLLARVLVAPAFLFRIENPPAGTERGLINTWELATRLSYFLWSSPPDEELRSLAKSGKLSEPAVLEGQVRRMLQDDRIRTLAIEFGTQWIHVRGFDEFNEKNEKVFPTFDANLRKAIYEESILFFQDLFQHDRKVTNILDADYTFLNESLAAHYEIPGVTGPEWRRVEGVRKYGRGGILGLASVQSRQAGASRSSPVLRGNWVVETLLGEKLPRPPANVPQLPAEEGDNGLTVRQQVELHAKLASCATCHVRIDPYGFALENYDGIGRFRKKDLAGLEIDAKAKLRDGTEFEGIDGIRTYLLTQKKNVVERLFCKRLLGYALGRAVTISDQDLLDEIVDELNAKDGRILTVVQAIVRSPQFRMIRGSEFSE